MGMVAEAERIRADLVLVGGGHAHVQILRRWMMRPVPGVRLTLVVDRPVAVYSGMVPGFVAGDYEPSELEIDVVPLARRARARVVLAEATEVDPGARRIALEGRPALPYDVASLDVGSTVRGLELPGTREHAVSTRPIGDFVRRVGEAVRRAAGARTGPLRIAVVGAGAAGWELAFTLRARVRHLGREAEITVLSDAPEAMPGYAARVAQRVRREAERRGIALRSGARAIAAEEGAVVLENGRVACDLAVWATGAAPVALIGDSPLPRDERGFALVRPTLEVSGCDGLFAAGDCAAIDGFPWIPKAGVYAVREGPVLDANLRAALSGGSLRPYRPQRDFLALLNLGEGAALGAKWGAVFAGGAVWKLKDRIDRRFVRRFQVLDAAGAPAPQFPSPESMGMDEMPCGGCAAKVEAPSLERALARLPKPLEDASVLVGLGRPDDAAALALPAGDVLLATVDAFPAFADDPWLVGRVAAVNAVSDVYAKGGRPRHALAWVSVPDGRESARAEETLFQVLAGVRAALDPLGVALVGGHSTAGDAVSVGLAVTGTLDDGDELLPLGGARPGDALVLTKPLGTGVILAADMRGLARGRDVRAALAAMLRPNADAARVARACGATACTDVSGFGLAGHLFELARASGVSVAIDEDTVPALAGARELLARGLRSSFHAHNEAAHSSGIEAPLLFDPQTSGGLLFALPAHRSDEAVRLLVAAGDPRAAVIGTAVPGARTPVLRA